MGRPPEIEPEAPIQRCTTTVDDLVACGFQLLGPCSAREKVVVAIVVNRQHVHLLPGHRRKELMQTEVRVVTRKDVAGDEGRFGVLLAVRAGVQVEPPPVFRSFWYKRSTAG
jgi:hypothetical protein